MFVVRLHRDERGSISIVTVFFALFLVMLLGMVMNVSREVDGKIRMQNAADSAAYSGGVVLARGMNTLAFTNHLLCEVFAMTAILRESRAENSASYTPQILAAWSKVASAFSASPFAKFQALGSAIRQKVPMEQQMVNGYSTWASSVSDQVLPLMEQILSQELIPQYQRAVLVAFPEIAQLAAQQTAERNGTPDFGRGPMLGVLWRSDAQPTGGGAETTYSTEERTLPVVDPEMDATANQSEYVATAVAQRRMLSHLYLNEWNAALMSGFDQLAKMSQFSNLWRSFTCGYLEHLLNVEYPNTNLPMVIYENPVQTANPTATLAQHYTFIGVVYWKKLPQTIPRLFHNPLEADSQAFAEVHLFIPQKHWDGSRWAVPARRVHRPWEECPARRPTCQRASRLAAAVATARRRGRLGGSGVRKNGPCSTKAGIASLPRSRSRHWPRSSRPLLMCPGLRGSMCCRIWAD